MKTNLAQAPPSHHQRARDITCSPTPLSIHWPWTGKRAAGSGYMQRTCTGKDVMLSIEGAGSREQGTTHRRYHSQISRHKCLQLADVNWQSAEAVLGALHFKLGKRILNIRRSAILTGTSTFSSFKRLESIRVWCAATFLLISVNVRNNYIFIFWE
jgi:hypothetical protein